MRQGACLSPDDRGEASAPRGDELAERPVLVTGGTGYLGRRVVARLTNQARLPWVLTRRPPAEDALRGSRSQAPRGTAERPRGNSEQWDPRHPDALHAWSQRPETVIHLAGLAHQHAARASRREYLRTNAVLARRLARAAKAEGVQHFILISSVAVYGPGCTATEEHQQRNPVGDYALSKAFAEDAVARLADENFAVTVIRLGTLFGGPDDPGNVSRLARQIQHPLLPRLTTAGNRKSLLWVEDAAEAIARLASRPPCSRLQTFNLAGGSIAMQEVVRSLQQNRRLPKIVPPIPSGLLLHACRVAGRIPPLGGFANRLQTTLVKWRSEDTFSSAAFEEQFGPFTTAPVALQLSHVSPKRGNVSR